MEATAERASGVTWAAGTAAATFGQEYLGAAELGDARRTARLVRVADRCAAHPGGTLPHKMATPADLKGLYRLLDADAVTHAAVLAPHRRRTLDRMAAHGAAAAAGR